MITVILVLELLAIAANLALPFTQDAALGGRAATIAREMVAVRDASVRAHAGRSDWPDQQAPGAPPAEVSALLPSGFSFSHEDYHFVWERWTLTDATELGLRQNDVAAVTVIADDPRLAALVARELPAGQTRLSVADRTTLVIDTPGTILP